MELLLQYNYLFVLQELLYVKLMNDIHFYNRCIVRTNVK